MHNDNEPRMEIRALLAIVLSMVVLTVYQIFFVPPPSEPLPAPPRGDATVDTAPGETAPVVPLPGEPEPSGDPTDTAAADPAVATDPAVGADFAEELVVRGDRYSATVTNVGGRLRSWIVTGFEDDDGGRLDLVSEEARAADQLPLSLLSPGDESLARAANAALYRLEVTGGRRDGDALISLPGDEAVVTLVWTDGRGARVSKRLVFPSDGSLLDVSVFSTTAAATATYLTLGPGLDIVENGSSNVFLGEGGVALADGALQKWSAADLEEPTTAAGAFRWAGVESHYFLAAFLLDRLSNLVVDELVVPTIGTAESASMPEGEAAGPTTVEMIRVGAMIGPDGLDVPVYLGPKKYDYLAEQGYDLRQVVDFGWFGFLARPMLFLLVGIESMVANYGLAIILLTVLIRIAFWPLNHKAMVSMRKTQALQPQMNAIRAKYRGVKDLEKRQKMNEEVMELYRKEGVSPLGGCLPMLLQLPFLFAFYRLLSVAVELRHAPFVLWIGDLSDYDPYLVLPLLMGGSMVVQQRMTPTAAANPMQARMMQMMPVIFTVIFLYVPSGLVLYWLVNNVLGIGQQAYINRRIDAAAEKGKGPSKPGKKPKKQGKKTQRGKR